MSRTRLRIVPFEADHGGPNMAADEVILRTALGGQATLRFYAWSEATLSLGYFQPARVRWEDQCLSSLPYVRRPSGGSALVHHFEVTYALALPAGPPWQEKGSWLTRMHGVIAESLRSLGVAARLHAPSGAAEAFPSPLCFQHLTSGDIVVDVAKVVGSAQRKQHGALMQHGGILLAGSPHAPSLPGIKELCGINLESNGIIPAIEKVFRAHTGWELFREPLSAQERELQRELVVGKYASGSWNDKR